MNLVSYTFVALRPSKKNAKFHVSPREWGTRNPIGWRPVERINFDGLNRLAGIEFRDDETMAGLLSHVVLGIFPSQKKDIVTTMT